MNENTIVTMTDRDGSNKTNVKFTSVDSLEIIKEMINSGNVDETQLFYTCNDSSMYMYSNGKLNVLVDEPDVALWEIYSGDYIRKILGSDFGQVIPYTEFGSIYREKEDNQNGL